MRPRFLDKHGPALLEDLAFLSAILGSGIMAYELIRKRPRITRRAQFKWWAGNHLDSWLRR